MQRAGGKGEEYTSNTKASNSATENTAEDNTQEDFEMKPTQTLEHSPSMDNFEESTKLASGKSDTSLEDESSLICEECEVKEVVNSKMYEGKENSNSSSLHQQTRRPRTRTRIMKLLSRGSLFAIGLAVLVVGGVSSNFTPYVEPWEYDNCTMITGQSIE